MQKGSAVPGSNTILYALIFLAMFLSLGHHIDHIIRGNHVGWPLTAEGMIVFVIPMLAFKFRTQMTVSCSPPLTPKSTTTSP